MSSPLSAWAFRYIMGRHDICADAPSFQQVSQKVGLLSINGCQSVGLFVCPKNILPAACVYFDYPASQKGQGNGYPSAGLTESCFAACFFQLRPPFQGHGAVLPVAAEMAVDLCRGQIIFAKND